MNSLKHWKDKGVLDEGSSLLLSRFVELIHLWNPRINLTGYRTPELIETRLIGESIAALLVLNLDEERVLDFGSGAGIPGLVWAICRPRLLVTSLEVRQKKVAFQKQAARDLGISVEVIGGLFPEAVQGREFDVVVSRAIRFDPSLWEKGESCLKPGGMYVRFVSPGAPPGGWNAIPASSETLLLTRHRA